MCIRSERDGVLLDPFNSLLAVSDVDQCFIPRSLHYVLNSVT